jgi:hypothetical protein
VHLAEREHDLPGTVIERVFVEELREIRARFLVLVGCNRVEADLELRVDNAGLRSRPLRTIRVAIDVGLPLLDRVIVFLLIEKELGDLKKRCALEFFQVLGW